MSQKVEASQKYDSFQALIDSITPEILGNLKSAVETGRWANGDRLTPEQVENSLQVIIAYEARYLSEEQRTGYIDTRGLKKSHCDEPGHTHAQDDSCSTEQTMTWVDTKPHSTH
ncbi:MAG: DUF1315 family protein [Gammaproteobacteria bacterium]|nr:DUF1315 family protein [Gammaproteobacteria bacterium]MDP2139281.1 DUF1315 family protein [Gammaproteobacteria bacterium]MDP2346697.1 DUF1315 family protein [Gammaproteobacteria bacterium]